MKTVEYCFLYSAESNTSTIKQQLHQIEHSDFVLMRCKRVRGNAQFRPVWNIWMYSYWRITFEKLRRNTNRTTLLREYRQNRNVPYGQRVNEPITYVYSVV